MTTSALGAESRAAASCGSQAQPSSSDISGMAAPFRFGSVQAALSGIDDGQLLNFEHIAANSGDKRAVLAHGLLVRRAQQGLLQHGLCGTLPTILGRLPRGARERRPAARAGGGALRINGSGWRPVAGGTAESAVHGRQCGGGLCAALLRALVRCPDLNLIRSAASASYA